MKLGFDTNLPGVTRILGIDKIKRREKTNIHWCIDAVAQVIHIFLAKVLHKRLKYLTHCILSLDVHYMSKIQSMYHINKAPINLRHPILETGDNSKFLLCSKDKIGPDLYLNQMPNFIEVKEAT